MHQRISSIRTIFALRRQSHCFMVHYYDFEDMSDSSNYFLGLQTTGWGIAWDPQLATIWQKPGSSSHVHRLLRSNLLCRRRRRTRTLSTLSSWWNWKCCRFCRFRPPCVYYIVSSTVGSWLAWFPLRINIVKMDRFFFSQFTQMNQICFRFTSIFVLFVIGYKV